jgi:hypothetical protein
MASALTLHSEALTKQKVSSIARNERECLERIMNFAGVGCNSA